jgi:8-oxo-dGTP diphosphatase
MVVGRCEEVEAGHRCDLPLGHAGPHSYWDDRDSNFPEPHFGTSLAACMAVGTAALTENINIIIDKLNKLQTPRVVRVGVAVIVKNVYNQVLFGLRSKKNSHGGGTWSLPGGHLEFDEDPEVAAARELLEETGIEVNPDSIHAYKECPYVNTHFKDTGKQYITLYMEVSQCITVMPELREPDKCDEWVWFSTFALPSPLFAPIVPEKLWKDSK